MLDNLRFYMKHSINDLRVNGQRTFFSLLCIAAGVAAIVALQTLAIMIQTSLIGGLQEGNRGDIQLQLNGGFSDELDPEVADQAVKDGLLDKDTQSFFGMEQDSYLISQGGVQAIQGWFETHYPGEAQITYSQPLTDQASIFLGGGNGTALMLPSTGSDVTQVVPVLIDSKVYPFYGQVTSEDGQTLAAMIKSPTDIVLSDQTAQTLKASIGDTIRISGSEAEFTVRGVVDAGQEVKNAATDILLSLYGFYYLDIEAVSLFPDVKTQTDKIYVKLTDPSKVVEVNEALVKQFPFINTTTTEDLRESYTQLSASIDKLVTVMGLLSMLIGSIGIINTMQVIVRRRTVEIAVLKTLGLQADQVTVLFLVEAVLMGIFGSLFGIILGWGLTFFIRGVAETLLATDLPFVIAPQPAIAGFLVGVIVTTVFGFLPTLTAGQVRPGVVLRPTDAILPKAGRVQSLLALGLIILVLSLIAQTILGSFTTALMIVVGAFLGAGILYLLLNLLIWLIGRFVPSFGIIDLKLSLRQMLAGRGRAAMTLLALVVGVFSLSTITLLSDSINSLLQFALDESSGGNVTISLASVAQLSIAESVLKETPGVQEYKVQTDYNLSLLSVQEGDQTLTRDDLRARLEASDDPMLNRDRDQDSDEAPEDIFDLLQSSVGRVNALNLNAPPERNFISGRALTLEDAGQPVMIIGENAATSAAGITVGDRLTYEIAPREDKPAGDATPNQTITFEVVGVMAQSGLGGFGSQSYAPADSFASDIPSASVSIIAQVDNEQIPVLRRALSGMPGVFMIENAAITRLIKSLLGTFTAFPTMVAALGLIVGGVVIANSVALTTMERRREIAVMKSVGLQRERVLFMILLENGILGLIGGLIGVGIGLVALVLLIGASGAPGAAIPVGTALLLMLLCVLVSLIAAISTAWGASGEKPLNVLRYE